MLNIGINATKVRMKVIDLKNRRDKRELARNQAAILHDRILGLSGSCEIMRKHIQDHNLDKALENVLYRSSIYEDDHKA